MKTFKELKSSESIFIVEIDNLNQKVNLLEKTIVETIGSSTLTIYFEDGSFLNLDERKQNDAFVMNMNTMYFTTHFMAHRQVKIEYNRMVEFAKMMVAKFQSELERWNKNKKNWEE